MGVAEPNEVHEAELDDIIRRASRLDRDAFGRIYGDYAPRIYRFFEYRTGNRELTEDLVNQAFMQALKAIGRYQHRSVPEFTGWIFRIARNVLSDHWRKDRGSARLDPDTDLQDLVDPVDDYDRLAKSEELRQAMEKLTPEQSEVIALRFSQDMTHAEIASILGKKETAVRALQFRAMTTLRAILAREGVE